MRDLKAELIEGVKQITRLDVPWEENLFGNAVDSMSLVEIVNLVEELAKNNSRTVDLDALISEEHLSLKDIYLALENGK